MATKKSTTTKAKTKTTKSTAAAKTRSTKTTAKKAPAKTAKVSPAKVNANGPKTAGINLLGLRKLHIAAVVAFVLLAVVAGVFMKADTYQLTIGHLAKDGLAEGTVLVPATRAFYDIEVRWIVVATMVLSAVLPVLYLTKLEKKYSGYLQATRMVPFRWIDFAVTGALMVETAALLSGVQDVFVLKMLGGLVAISFVLGLIAERQNDKVNKSVWSAYATGVFSGVLPWVLIAAYAVTTVVSGAVHAPWYVYGLYAVLVAGLVAGACVSFTDYRRKKAAWQQNYLLVERNYLTVSVLTKIAFALVLIAGLHR